MQEPLLGEHQRFPLHCHDCREWFRVKQRIVMLPVLREGEIVSVGRWPNLTGDVNRAPPGKPLWYVWLCTSCAPRWLHKPAADDVDDEEAREVQRAAERELDRATTAAGRMRKQQQRRPVRY